MAQEESREERSEEIAVQQRRRLGDQKVGRNILFRLHAHTRAHPIRPAEIPSFSLHTRKKCLTCRTLPPTWIGSISKKVRRMTKTTLG